MVDFSQVENLQWACGFDLFLKSLTLDTFKNYIKFSEEVFEHCAVQCHLREITKGGCFGLFCWCRFVSGMAESSHL